MQSKLILFIYLLTFSFQAQALSKESWNCFSEASLNGATPEIVGDFWDFHSGSNSAYEFPGYIDENGDLQRAGEKRFFLTYLFTVDQCSFNTNHKIKLVAFEDGEVLMTETHNSWQDNASKPVRGIILGYIDNPPTHGSRVGRNEIGRFIRKIKITYDLDFSFDISRKRSIVGAYGIPMGISTSCKYEMSITTPLSYGLNVESAGHYGRDDLGYKRCL